MTVTLTVTFIEDCGCMTVIRACKLIFNQGPRNWGLGLNVFILVCLSIYPSDDSYHDNCDEKKKNDDDFTNFYRSS